MSRLTIEFPDEGDKILKKLAEDDSTSKREVIRRALALYNYLHEEGVKKDTGKRLSITDKEGAVLKDILF
jgi:predicted transcriptional regulator